MPSVMKPKSEPARCSRIRLPHGHVTSAWFFSTLCVYLVPPSHLSAACSRSGSVSKSETTHPTRPREWIGAPFTRESAGLSQPPRPRDERVALLLVQQLRERGGWPLFHESSQVVAHAVGQRLAREIPDHRPQLGLDVEAEPVVDGPDAAVGSEQAVAALAVGVVGDQIERADPGELITVRGLLAEREVVLGEVRVHELLQRAFAVGPIAPHREGHEPPAERLREVIRGQLALEEAGRKIPEGALGWGLVPL